MEGEERVAVSFLVVAALDVDVVWLLADRWLFHRYIANMFGEGRFTVKPGEKEYADYLYWFHFGNGTLQPAIGRAMVSANTSAGIAAYFISNPH